jgi:hypothetical protein
MGRNYWWAFVAAAVVGCGGAVEASTASRTGTTSVDYVRCTQGQLDACDPATRAAAEQQLERRKQVDAQTARIRCLQGELDSCDPATRSVMEQRLEQQRQIQARAAQQRRCFQGELDQCDPAIRATFERRAAQAAQDQQQQQAIAAAQRAETERTNKIEWQVCYHLANKQQLERGMAQERANPSGVVDLSELHEYGGDIQAETQYLADSKAEFLKERGRPFTLKDCDGNYP